MPDPVLLDDAVTCPWRTSLRRSRKRRTEALRRHLRRRRTRNLTVALSTAMLFGAGSALAATPTASLTVSLSAVQRALRVPADGVQGPVTQRALRAFQASHGLLVDGVVGPQTERVMGLGPEDGAGSTHRSRATDTARTARTHESGPFDARLARIARCESGGDARAVSADGRYRGRYQFDLATWRAVGGSGDPASASAAEQDRRAAALLAAQGPSAWPACAR